MTAHNGNTEQDERGLLPYPVIIAATKGDPEAMKIVVQHYESYIASLSMRKLIDERGNTYYGTYATVYGQSSCGLSFHSRYKVDPAASPPFPLPISILPFCSLTKKATQDNGDAV